VSEAPTSVSRYDPSSGELQRRYRLPQFLTPSVVVFGHGAAWVAATNPGGGGAVLRIDARSGRARRVTVGSVPSGLATTSDAVWVADLGDDDVRRLDPDTAQVEKIIDVGHAPGGLATDGVSVGVSNTNDRTISRIDTATDAVVDTLSLPYYPTHLTYGHGYLWVVLDVALTFG
jgi:streptogramin lyase